MSVQDRVIARWRTCSVCGYREGDVLVYGQKRCDHRWLTWERREHMYVVDDSPQSDDPQ